MVLKYKRKMVLKYNQLPSTIMHYAAVYVHVVTFSVCAQTHSHARSRLHPDTCTVHTVDTDEFTGTEERGGGGGGGGGGDRRVYNGVSSMFPQLCSFSFMFPQIK